MEHDSTVYVGLDVHKESITVAYAIGMGDVELFGKIGTAKSDIEGTVWRQIEQLHAMLA
jgi:transposase